MIRIYPMFSDGVVADATLSVERFINERCSHAPALDIYVLTTECSSTPLKRTSTMDAEDIMVFFEKWQNKVRREVERQGRYSQALNIILVVVRDVLRWLHSLI
jgi:hypothetical protein